MIVYEMSKTNKHICFSCIFLSTKVPIRFPAKTKNFLSAAMDHAIASNVFRVSEVEGLSFLCLQRLLQPINISSIYII